MICIHHNNGRVLQGVVLAFADRQVRIAIKDSDDAVEFRLVNEVWVSEDCEVVRLDFSELGRPPAIHEADPCETAFRSHSQPVHLQRVM
jgi:hypothetical protein